MLSAGELNDAGAKLWKENADLEAARFHFASALDLDPNHMPAMRNLANTLGLLNKYETALVVGHQIVARQPDDWRMWNNIGTWEMLSLRYDLAEKAMLRSCKINSLAIEAYHNRALLYHRQNRSPEALQMMEKVIELGHDGIPVRNDIAHVMLKLAKSFQDSLKAYEVRWEVINHARIWDYYIPEWKGEDLDGKTIGISEEQGFGDTFMCLRYAFDLQARGAKVICVVSPALRRICEAQGFEVINSFTFNAEDAKRFDYQTPFFSAPLHLGVEWNNIVGKPYMKAPSLMTPDVDKNFYNVGICWASGRRGSDMDTYRRHAPLSEFLGFAKIPGVRLHSLQKGEDREDISNLMAEGLIIDNTSSLADWAATAAYINKLDLVVSVDTAIPHLSAALGKPTWMVAQHANCWRWQDIKDKTFGTGLPWYNSMTIRRQPDPFDWKTPINDFISDLRDLDPMNLRDVA